MSAEIGIGKCVGMLFDRLEADPARPAIWEDGHLVTCAQLLERSQAVTRALRDAGVESGSIVGFSGDFGLNTIAAFLGLFRTAAVAVPLSSGASSERSTLIEEAQIEYWLDPVTLHIQPLRQSRASHALLHCLRQDQHPGLIVFTSGSTGKPKAILHDVERVAAKFAVKRQSWRMILFLLIDHFGGFNTLLACLAYGGLGICPAARTPDAVCEAVAGAGADLLPTTPTFLSLLIASGAWRRHDLSTIRLVTYGAEPMPESTLRRLPEIFPRAEFKQTYGLSELGVLQSASPSSDSLWLRVGGRDFETRVVDGLLHIRSRSSMLGYLNAVSTIDAEGWMNTGDVVEQHGDLIRIVGRVSDVINVGGQKVFPVEVESVLQEHPLVREATVHAIAHPVLGQVVGARISIAEDQAADEVLVSLRAHCKARLQKYKVPMRFDFVAIDQHGNERGKKVRR